jgi:hypothetical protein
MRKPNGLFLAPLLCSDILYRSSAAMAIPNRLDPDADALAPAGADRSLFASRQHGISRN